MNCSVLLLSLAISMYVSACAQSAHQTGRDELQRLIPADVMASVDETVSFADLRTSPSNYVGRTVVISGVALNARRVKDGTEIEILQLPSGRDMVPSDRKSKSEGRFLAVQSNGFLDPAIIEKDSPLTVVGEVKGATTKQLDEGEYRYPVLDIKKLIDWNDLRSRDGDGYYDSDYYGRYGGYYGPPYGLYPYGYYGPWYGLPPVSSRPPQFQKGQ